MIPPRQSVKLELQRRIISVLKADSELQTLLFPAWTKPRINDEDDRIYRSQVDFSRVANGTDLAQIPVRVLIEARRVPHQMEQDDLEMGSGEVSLYVHVLVPKDQYLHGDRIMQRVRHVLLSTGMSDSRIIAGDLFEVGDQLDARESNFQDAHRLTQQFRSASVGVLTNA